MIRPGYRHESLEAGKPRASGDDPGVHQVHCIRNT